MCVFYSQRTFTLVQANEMNTVAIKFSVLKHIKIACKFKKLPCFFSFLSSDNDLKY